MEPTPTRASHQAILDDLVARGADLARQIHEKATAGEIELEAATVAFERTARAIRRTVLLSQRLDEPATPARERTAARKQVLRAVEDTISRKAGPEDSLRLHAELRERIEAPDLEDEIGHRPTADIIADILRDLGIAHQPGHQSPWPRRTPEQALALHERAAKRRNRLPLPQGEGRGEGHAARSELPSRATSCDHPPRATPEPPG